MAKYRQILAWALPVLLFTGFDIEATTKASPENFIPAPDEILDSLNPEHPRLIARRDDFVRLKTLIQKDETSAAWYRKLKDEGRGILVSAASTYQIPDGLRLLQTSRAVLERVYTLAFLFWMEGDSSYVDRTWQELDSAAHFPDWNPKHFLDTAEMTHAFAIAYDWLHQSWSREQRDILREAIVRHGLRPALEAYEGQSPHGWWTKAEHNWNQVCNGGIAIGALAVAGEEPDLASRVLYEALHRLPEAMIHYGPDGGWNEGPGYWHYATSYNVYVLAALQTALGTDFGLSEIDGFSEAGSFPIFMTGPTNRTFNFADSRDGAIRAEEMFWLANRFRRPEYSSYQLRQARASSLDLLWANGPDREQPDLPLDRYYRGVEVVSMRTSWVDPDAFFLGFKAGDNTANHSHLDIGSFVLDGLGERWVVDLGPDNYNLPGYFDKGTEGTRWTYYRLRAEGHNTLVVNPGPGPDQDPGAAARITSFESLSNRAFVRADLTQAYFGALRKAFRGIELLRGTIGKPTAVVIRDEIELDQPAVVWWFLHTPAQVSLSPVGRHASLRLRNKRLSVELLSPRDATFTLMDARSLPSSPDPSGQAVNQGILKLAIQLPEVEATCIEVRIGP